MKTIILLTASVAALSACASIVEAALLILKRLPGLVRLNIKDEK